MGEFEELGKSIFEELAALRGARLETEAEVRTHPQRLDLIIEPQGRPHPDTPPLFERMFDRTCAVELFIRAPGPNQLAQVQRKLLNDAHQRAKAAQSESLLAHALTTWVLVGGKPLSALRRFDARTMTHWPRGFHRLSGPIDIHVVVLPELPQTRDTLWLRLMAPSTFHAALADLATVADNSEERRRLSGPTLRFWADNLGRQPDEERSSMKSKEWYEAEVARIHGEGREKGRHEGRSETLRTTLPKMIELRFGPPSEATLRRIAEASADQLERWTDAVLTAESVDALLRS